MIAGLFLIAIAITVGPTGPQGYGYGHVFAFWSGKAVVSEKKQQQEGNKGGQKNIFSCLHGHPPIQGWFNDNTKLSC